MMYHFCTYFDKNYLVRGLALYESLVEHVPEFRLYILCFDDEVYNFFKLSGYKHIVPISQNDFENGDEELIRCKSTRNRVEYYFTCTPSLPLYIMNTYDDIDLVTYLDADLYFFSSPEPIFREFGNDSILIIGHQFSDSNKHMVRYGKYNVGYISFRNDSWGRECLAWWRDQCIEWCFDREENGRFADQKYLDCWPERFKNVCEIKHKGANLAPWNVDNYTFHKRGVDFFVDEDKLLFYHFHGLNRQSTRCYNLGSTLYNSNLKRFIIRYVYSKYLERLEHIAGSIKTSLGHNRYSTNISPSVLDTLALAENEVMLYYFKWFPSVNISRILQPLFAAKRLISGCVAILTKRP